jgi:hypothetical protein
MLYIYIFGRPLLVASLSNHLKSSGIEPVRPDFAVDPVAVKPRAHAIDRERIARWQQNRQQEEAITARRQKTA